MSCLFPGSKNQEESASLKTSAANVELTDEEFRMLEAALNARPVHGHRGHVETVQGDFGSNWKKKED